MGSGFIQKLKMIIGVVYFINGLALTVIFLLVTIRMEQTTAPTAVQRWMVMGMARGLADGLLRFCNGSWRDNDGDAVDIVEVIRCKDCKWWK
jgi:hypothetical protein